MQISASVRKQLSLIFRIAITIIAFGFVAERIITSPDIKYIGDYLGNIKSDKLIYLIVIIVLMPLNWIIETIKWRHLISKTENISFGKSFCAVWAGVTAGTITPNRIGEFGGRIIFLKKENRTSAVPLTLFGDLSQFIVTVVLGLVGFLLLSNNLFFKQADLLQLKVLTIILAITFTVISLLVYFNFNSILRFVEKASFLNKFLNKSYSEIKLSVNNKLYIILLSGLRYLIFASQYYLSLLVFGIDIGIFNAFIAISSMYLCVHIIPNISIAEIGIRASFAILFIGLFSSNHTATMFSSLLIYIINIAIPVIFGGIFLIKQK